MGNAPTACGPKFSSDRKGQSRRSVKYQREDSRLEYKTCQHCYLNVEVKYIDLHIQNCCCHPDSSKGPCSNFEAHAKKEIRNHNPVHGEALENKDDDFVFDYGSFSSSEISQHTKSTNAISCRNYMWCEFCHGLVLKALIPQHKNTCKQNPKNKLEVCKFCNKELKTALHEPHLWTCPLNPENSKKPCEFCQENTAIWCYDNHTRVCSKNPKNIRSFCDNCNKVFNEIDLSDHIKTCGKEERFWETKQSQYTMCCICLEEINDENCAYLACLHNFHLKCIQDWSKKQKSCPICRTLIE